MRAQALGNMRAQVRHTPTTSAVRRRQRFWRQSAVTVLLLLFMVGVTLPRALIHELSVHYVALDPALRREGLLRTTPRTYVQLSRHCVQARSQAQQLTEESKAASVRLMRMVLLNTPTCNFETLQLRGGGNCLNVPREYYERAMLLQNKHQVRKDERTDYIVPALGCDGAGKQGECETGHNRRPVHCDGWWGDNVEGDQQHPHESSTPEQVAYDDEMHRAQHSDKMRVASFPLINISTASPTAGSRDGGHADYSPQHTSAYVLGDFVRHLDSYDHTSSSSCSPDAAASVFSHRSSRKRFVIDIPRRDQHGRARNASAAAAAGGLLPL